MVRNGEFALADVKRVIRRKWWVIPVCVMVCGATGVLAALKLPKKYTSQTLVLVAKPMVPVEYVKPIVTEDLNQRVSSMKDQILSRSWLEPVIEKFGLYKEDRRKVPMEQLVEKLRAAIEISPLEPMPGTLDRSMPGFHVSVTFSNAQTAQQICTEITSMFREQNSQALVNDADSTNSFVSEHLEEAKAKLDQQDAKVAQFRREHIGLTPEEGPTNLNRLTTLNSQIEANTQALNAAQQDKAFNESLLSQQEANWKASQTGQNPETLDVQIQALQDQLTSLEARYTPEHPDVIKTKKLLEELRKKSAAAPKTLNSSGETQTKAEPANIQLLRARVRQDEMNIAGLTKQQGQIQDQIRTLQARMEASPMVEQQLKELTRNYQSALEFYNDLQKKRESSQMAKDLAHQREGEEFRVLDAPNLPVAPSFPKKTYFAGGGVGGGFALSLAILYILMMMDKTLHTERDVELQLKLIVLATVPVLEVVQGSNRNSGLLKGSVATNA
jgi:polysaccharide chain length determinant protein (PEP-CTERM system associated)